MNQIIIRKVNNSCVHLNTSKTIIKNIVEKFSCYEENYKFDYRYKCGIWDGLFKFVDYNKHIAYFGIWKDIKEYCENDLKIDCTIDDKLLNDGGINISEEDIYDFCEKIKTPFKPYDYQVKIIRDSLCNKKQLSISATGSGKSFIIYILFLLFLHINNKESNILLVVPNIQLVKQMKKNFKIFSKNLKKNFVDEYMHFIYSGQKKNSNKKIIVSTWQSLKSEKIDYFKKFDLVMIDEVHKAKAEKLRGIVNKCINCEYKFGLTGFLNYKNKSMIDTLHALFSKTKKYTTAKELIDKKILSNFEVKSFILKYPYNQLINLNRNIKLLSLKKANFLKPSSVHKYQSEIHYLNMNQKRTEFILKLIENISNSNNTLILVKSIYYGQILSDHLTSISSNKKVFFVHGVVNVNIREDIRKYTEDNNNVIIIATYKTFSEGIDISNLYNLILAESVLSPITVIQSIGRILRTLRTKENKNAVLYDITDDLRREKHIYNFTLRHFLKRCSYYKDEKHKNTIYEHILGEEIKWNRIKGSI